MKLLRLLALVVSLAAACGTATHPPAATGLPATSTTTTTRPPLPPLPEHGLVAGTDTGIDVLTTDATIVGHVEGLSAMGNDLEPDAIYLTAISGEQTYRLDPALGTLAASPRPRPTGPDDWLDLLAPAWAGFPDGRARGHWRYALRSPDGATWLAQWSGECESQTAWLVPVAGGEPRPAGPRSDDGWAFSSGAIGWAADGRAIVAFDEAVCGTPIGRPGTYLVALDGTPTFLTAAHVFGAW